LFKLLYLKVVSIDKVADKVRRLAKLRLKYLHISWLLILGSWFCLLQSIVLCL